MELGDQRPSQLLRRMRELARDKVPDDTLKLLWQPHLPASVRAILAVTPSKDLDALATVADKVMESTGLAHIAEIKSTTPSETSTAGQGDGNQILGELAKISVRLEKLERGRPKQRQENRNYRSGK
ncbi:uncharacterized protein LOC126381472 [Pectinophora gossypiella]|uniref:uncharacterized protein LOC126381472 n=1 Tax=Pectinophora gossypiella TaxID=13191 RepID=UPI00214EDB6F|nr:uncharacterized protein LOC126381472 [Pectinophora gossypiella]